MCGFKVLNQNENGYVVRCEECGHIQMAFGNVAIVIAEDKFISFKTLIEEYYIEKKQEEEKEVKNIYLETPAKNISLVLSVNDITNLHELLSEAYLNLQIQNLLQTA